MIIIRIDFLEILTLVRGFKTLRKLERLRLRAPGWNSASESLNIA